MTLHSRVLMKLGLCLCEAAVKVQREGRKEEKHRRKAQGSSSDTTTHALCDLGRASSSLGLWSPKLQNALN